MPKRHYRDLPLKKGKARNYSPTVDVIAWVVDFVRSLPRILKRIVMVIYDAVALFGAGWVIAQWNTTDPIKQGESALIGALAGIFIILVCGGYTAVVRFMGLYTRSVFGLGIVGATVMWGASISLPVSSVVYCVSGFILVFAPRLLLRELDFISHRGRASPTRVAIYGAGKAGRQLAWSLRADARYRAVLFIDDSLDLQGAVVHGLRVFGPTQLPKLIQRHQIHQVFFAIPSAPPNRRTEIFLRLMDLAVKVQTVPELHELIDGDVNPTQLRSLRVEDILNRDTVPANPLLLSATIESKVVLVSGAGGSIGSELCRTVYRLRPKALIIFDLSEVALYQIEQDLRGIAKSLGSTAPVLHVILGSVLDTSALRAAFSVGDVDTVFHAAAYKHVPLIESNVIEGVKNNIFGTLAIVNEVKRRGVSAFVFVSTDKAVRPTNVMGASKRVAEMVVQVEGHGAKCCYSIVRFGNVLGSSGSVLPLFHEQIGKGGPITVTHPDVTRYFMTIPEAAQLVIQTGALGRDGDIYHLDMGQPVRILDLARRLLGLYGLREQTSDYPQGIGVSIIGLRPGEKLYEELLIGPQARHTQHPRIFAAQEPRPTGNELEQTLQKLTKHCGARDVRAVLECLRETVEGFVQHVATSNLGSGTNEMTACGYREAEQNSGHNRDES